MFLFQNKEYADALERFVLANEALSTIMLPEARTPCTPQDRQMPEGSFEARRIAKMKIKAELEVSRTPATATIIATPKTARFSTLDVLRDERELPLSARLWRQTSHASLADELSSFDVGSSSESDGEEAGSGSEDEYSDLPSSLPPVIHQDYAAAIGSMHTGLEVASLPFRYARPGSSASMASVSSFENSLAMSGRMRKLAPSTLTGKCNGSRKVLSRSKSRVILII